MSIDVQSEYAKLASERGYVEQGSWRVLEVTGNDREKFLHNLLSQHLVEQTVGERRWSTILNSKGRLIGFFQVWKFSNRFLLLIHDTQFENVVKTLETYWITEDIQMNALPDLKIVTTFIQSKEILLKGYPYETNKIVEENILRCATDDYFIPSVTMIVHAEQKKNIISNAFPISNELAESIRIQSAFPLPKQDYDDPIPIEIPFMHRAISFTKGCYVGQETIARLHARGLNVSKKLLLFSADENVKISAQDIVMQDQTEVGKVTSFANSPIENKKIGLAWIHRNAFGKSVTINNHELNIILGE